MSRRWYGPAACGCGCVDPPSSSSSSSSSSESESIDPCDCENPDATYFIKLTFEGFPEHHTLYGIQFSNCGCQSVEQRDWGVLNGTYFVPLQRSCVGSTSFAVRDAFQVLATVPYRRSLGCRTPYVEQTPYGVTVFRRISPNGFTIEGGGLEVFTGVTFPVGNWCSPDYPADFAGSRTVSIGSLKPDCSAPGDVTVATISWELVAGEL